MDVGANIDAQNKNGNTAIMFAIVNGQLECVRTLMDGGANIDAQNNNYFGR